MAKVPTPAMSRFTTPGMRTSEFLLTGLVNVITVLDYAHVWTFAPPAYAVALQGIVTGLYILSRGVAKHGTRPGA